MKQFLIAFVTLALIHSAVSFAAFRLFTKSTVLSSFEGPPVETTTTEQRDAGEASFVMTNTKSVMCSRPTVVVFYMWSGYFGLIVSALYALYSRLFQTH